VLEREGALEKLAAVQTTSQNEVTFKQRTGFAEYLDDFVLRHAGSLISKSQVQRGKFANRA